MEVWCERPCLGCCFPFWEPPHLWMPANCPGSPAAGTWALVHLRFKTKPECGCWLLAQVSSPNSGVSVGLLGRRPTAHRLPLLIRLQAAPVKSPGLAMRDWQEASSSSTLNPKP